MTNREVWEKGGAVLVVGRTFAHADVLFREWPIDQAATVSRRSMSIRSKGGGVAFFVSMDVDPHRLIGLQLDRIVNFDLLPWKTQRIAKGRLRGTFASVK